MATNLCEWCFSFPSISLFATSGQSSSDERTQSHSMKIDMVGPLLSPPCKIASGPCEPLHAVANSSLAQVNDSATPTRHASLREIRGKSEQTEASPDAYWLMVLKDLQRGKKREKARTVRLANSVVLRTSVITSVAISAKALAAAHQQVTTKAGKMFLQKNHFDQRHRMSGKFPWRQSQHRREVENSEKNERTPEKTGTFARIHAHAHHHTHTHTHAHTHTSTHAYEYNHTTIRKRSRIFFWFHRCTCCNGTDSTR